MTGPARRHEEVRLTVAARRCHMSVAHVRRYVEIGLVRPSRSEGDTPLFGEPALARLRRIRRLREDLGLNEAGVEVVLRLLDEIEALHREHDARAEPRQGRRRGG